MDIKSTMSEYGFGHRSTSHIIIDHNGELWLTMAPVAVGGFLPLGMTSLPGTLRIEPLEDGVCVPFTYTVSEVQLELKTGKGATVRFVANKDVQALVIKGNCALRLNGVEAASHAISLKTEAGVTLSVGSNRYFITAARGKISFDDTYLLDKFCSVTPVLDIAPEDGEFELYVFDLAADKDTPTVTKTPEECAQENSAEWRAFLDELVDIPSEWSDVKEKLAYPIWLCQRVLDGKNEVTVENKYNSKNTSAALMAIASMAFKDAKRAVDMLLAYPAQLPPIAGVAAARLIDENMLCDSRGEIYRVYSALEAVARYCIKERTADREGLSFYAYRFESGLDSSPSFFDVGEPVLAPDLNAYLIIVCEVLGRLAGMEYDDGIAKKWEAQAKKLTAKLIAELWDGESFIGRNAYSGKASSPDTLLSLIPIVLGGRLPVEVICKLAADIDAIEASACDESNCGRLSCDGSLYGDAAFLLLAGGLSDAGASVAGVSAAAVIDIAKKIVKKALDKAREGAVKSPFRCAALLAMAHKVL